MARWFVLRPTFDIALDAPRDMVVKRLGDLRLPETEAGRFLIHGEYGELHLPEEEHRLWSPHLSFYVTEHGGRALVRGRFAPRLDVWTTVWILYLAMACTAFFSFMMALSQWAIGESTFWHWPGMAALLSLGVIYLVAHVGQQWSADQMNKLRAWLEDLLRQVGGLK